MALTRTFTEKVILGLDEVKLSIDDGMGDLRSLKVIMSCANCGSDHRLINQLFYYTSSDFILRRGHATGKHVCPCS